MKDYANPFDDEDQVHPGTRRGRIPWQYGLAHQRNNHASAVAVKLRGLNNSDSMVTERLLVLTLACITSASLIVRLTGRLRVDGTLNFILKLQMERCAWYAHIQSGCRMIFLFGS